MIRKFKIFENSKQGTQVGDYVAINYRKESSLTAIEFLNNTIGKIIKMDDAKWRVKFEKDYGGENNFYFKKEEVLFYSKNREEVEAYLASRKYNL